eukprot:2917049-Pyramimonas_sp.AAC.1
MLFDGEAAFDLDPFLFQLSNCAIDLRSDTARPGRPTDATSPRGPILRAPEAGGRETEGGRAMRGWVW